MDSNSKSFCILPFIHLYADPNGEMKPCCISDGFDESLNLKNLSIEDAFNSPQMKGLRRDMLQGKQNKICNTCYKKEEVTSHSPRIEYNNNPYWSVPIINDNYSVPLDFQYIDVRFSNLCNFKCRMCFHTFSSHWYEDSKKVRKAYNPKSKVLKVSDTIVDDLKPYLSKLKNIYFAGGEPLIMPEHFEILKYLYDSREINSKNNKIPISINYNTNLSVIKYDEQSLIDLWKRFYKVLLCISCDGVGEVGEYQRNGFNTKKFEENLNILKKYATPTNIYNAVKGMFYSFQYTTTIMNVYHIFDFIDYMLEKNHITDSDQIDFYYASSPNEYSLSQITDLEKEKVCSFLEEKMNNYSEKTKEELQRIIDFTKSDIKDDGYDKSSSIIFKILFIHHTHDYRFLFFNFNLL